MKKPIFILAAVMFAGWSILSSCTSHEQKVENAEQKVQDAKEDVQENKQDLDQLKQGSDSDFQNFKNEANDEINSNDQRIAELRIEMKNENSGPRERDGKKVDALEKKNHELKEKLENYHNDGKSDWREFRTEFKHDLNGIGKAFKDITIRNTK